VIGILLAGVAVLLGRESGALLLGESADKALVRRIRKIIAEDPAVEEVGSLLTMHLGPDQVLLNAEIKFREKLTVRELEAAIDRRESRIRQHEASVQRIFIEADSLRSRRRSAA